MIPIDLLRATAAYDAQTGKIVWLARPQEHFATTAAWKMWTNRFCGKPAFATPNNGYFVGRLYNKTTKAHRVAWALHYGEWPLGHLDHINGDRSDNRICNLRRASPKENGRNQGMHKTNTSTQTGVVWSVRQKRWCARIVVNGTRLHLGTFRLFSEASDARALAEQTYGFHENHGKRKSHATTPGRVSRRGLPA